MYAYIKGTIVEKTEENLVLENQGIGYNIRISAGTLERLPMIGEQVKIYTYTSVREDAFWLYGFLSKDDLEMFKKLIAVNGIGPKGGLAVLSVLTSQDLRFAIISGDAKRIAKAPGIGAKTAERVILELKDKVSLEETLESVFGTDEEVPSESHESDAIRMIRTEAQQALTALGFGAADALRAVSAVAVTEGMDPGEVLRLALASLRG